MKTIFTLCFLAVSGWINAQSLADVSYIKLEKKYPFQDTENEYRINTNLKYRFEQLGYKVYFAGDEVPAEVKANPCAELVCSVLENKKMMATNLNLRLTDCKGKQIVNAKGESRLKVHKKSYLDAVDQIFKYTSIPAKQ